MAASAGLVTFLPPGSDIRKSTCKVLVDPVDCSGAQGKALALLFAQEYPRECALFRAEARAGNIRPGEPHYVYTRDPGDPACRVIAFFATKLHFSQPSRLEYMRIGLPALAKELPDLGLTSVAIPALGCGEGELAWGDVKPLLEEAAKQMAARGVRVELYEPHARSSQRRMTKKNSRG